LEWEYFNFCGVVLSGVFILDFYSILFSIVVLLISSMIFFYSKYYIDEDKNQLGFGLLLTLFVLSILFLIFSPNLVMLLLGWDGLGLTSYLLVVYYIRFSSSVAGIVTFLTNRLGDVFFLFSIGFIFFYGSWDFYSNKLVFYLLSFFLIFSFITKRAQVPFSSWLPMAIAAPTPVSSLVHSSTLVTAGVFLLIRFNFMVIPLSYFLLVLRVMTLLIAGVIANFEWDLKKLIALSTLSQLGFMIFSYSIGLVLFSFFHLIRHALFKASLFMSSGVIIHSMDNRQEFRNSGLFTQVKPLLSMAVVVCLICLCGFPFTSGFFSKDLILDGGACSFLLTFFFFFLFF
jgi:NADH-ubiquinone oxidoreductase chain 5